MNKQVRWKQRFSNLQKAFKQLESAVSLKDYSDLERAGLIQTFEFCFELCWKTLKDYLSSEGLETQFPREVIKKAFASEILSNGDVWIDMLDKRNTFAHTYEEKLSIQAVATIKSDYFPPIKELIETLNAKLKS